MIDLMVIFLPHHGVFKPNHSTTKCRVVFNGSAKTKNGNCLNDFLLPGPKMLPDIVRLLLRLRNANIFVIGDISRMYMQIGLRPEDRKYVRFLWYDPTLNDNDTIRTYRFKKIPFGLRDSPFSANYGSAALSAVL